MAIVTVVFHLLIFALPVLLNAHNILAGHYLGISSFSFPDYLMDKLTILLIFICIIFLMRRIFISRVRILTTLSDYLILFLVMMPFITGFAAYHQLFYYKSFMLIHIITGEIAIIAIPFTKLGHMPFFIFARFFISGEHNLKLGNRTWFGSGYVRS